MTPVAAGDLGTLARGNSRTCETILAPPRRANATRVPIVNRHASLLLRGLPARIAAALAMTLALVGASPAQPSNVDGALAKENAALIRQNAEVTSALAIASEELANLHRAKDDLDAMMQRIGRRAEVHVIGKEFAQTVVRRLDQLPGAERFAQAREARAAQVAATSDANLRTEQALETLRDLDQAVEDHLAAAPPAAWEDRPRIEADLRAALVEQRDLLQRLSQRQHDYIDALRDVEVAERDLEQRYTTAHDRLMQILYWTPAQPGRHTLGAVPPALAWTFSPSNWRAAASALAQSAGRTPILPAAAVLTILLLLAARPWLKRMLVTLEPAVVTYRHYHIGHALGALACTAALAAPGPLLLWTAQRMLADVPEPEQFVAVLRDSLTVTWRLLLILLLFAWLLDRRGVVARHFGGEGDSLAFAARALRRFTVFFVPMVFVAALNAVNTAPWAHRESLGRLLFIVAMAGNAVFLFQLLRRRSPLLHSLFRDSPHSFAAGLHGFWLGAIVALPLAVAVLAVTGYFVVAEFFWRQFLTSAFLVIIAVVLYGLMALWVQVQRQRLDLLHRDQAARLAPAQMPSAPGETAVAPPPRVDLAALGEQTRALLDVLVTALLLAGLWLVWRDALPNLSVVSDFPLWTVTDNVAGKEMARRLTINSLLLVVLVAAITFVVVRNIGALLDIVFLQRLGVQADANYAIKVIARYTMAAAGLLIAARILSIDWSDAQWLVAALGVGLGFGLQEIVANFVSGLIVLAERPIRIGDTVTVGEVTGRVTGIRARSTRVIDDDNKEVIIPNKAFITERVTNWTLSSQVTRLLLKVGVAYGNDIERVRQILLDAVRANPDVMPAPAPSVHFVNFGDSSLDFEIRLFVDALDKRLRVKHDVYRTVGQVLAEHGIEMPFPQRDLHIRTATGLTEALRAGGPA